MLRALSHNVQMYEQQFGAIVEPPQGETSTDGAN
jgi:hypothetical protein